MKDDIGNLLDGLPVGLAQRLIDRYEKASLAYCYKNWSNLFSESGCFFGNCVSLNAVTLFWQIYGNR